MRDSWETRSKILVEDAMGDTVGDKWETAGREVGDKGKHIGRQTGFQGSRWETSWETSRETSWETNWETRGTRPRECGHTIHQRASWEKGGKASGRQTRHPTAAGRPVNAHLHSHSVSVCFTAAMTGLC